MTIQKIPNSFMLLYLVIQIVVLEQIHFSAKIKCTAVWRCVVAEVTVYEMDIDRTFVVQWC